MLVYLQMLDDAADRESFAQIYDRYKNLMFVRAYQILHNEQDAEDAVHEAFLAIARSFQKVKCLPEKPQMSYIMMCTIHEAIDLYKKNRKQSTAEVSELLNNSPDLTCEDERVREMTQLILELPPNYREVIILKYCYGYTLKEIAGFLQITPSNAEKINQRAKKLLRERYEREGVL